MEAEALTVFRSEVHAQLERIGEVYERIERRSSARSESEVESLAYQLHNLYCAFEDLFELVAERFENNLETGGTYHMALLQRMAIDIEGVRPALVDEPTLRLLDNLRGFRHVFRHAYSYVLDERKVRLVLDDARALREVYRQQVEAFIRRLAGDSDRP